MLFIPTLPLKAEFTAMLSKAKNTKQCRLSNAGTVNVKPLPLKLNSALNSLAKQFSSTAWLNSLAIQLQLNSLLRQQVSQLKILAEQLR